MCNDHALQSLTLCIFARTGCPFLTGVPRCLSYLQVGSSQVFGSIPYYDPVSVSPTPTPSRPSGIGTSSSDEGIGAYVYGIIAVAICMLVSVGIIYRNNLRCWCGYNASVGEEQDFQAHGQLQDAGSIGASTLTTHTTLRQQGLVWTHP